MKVSTSCLIKDFTSSLILSLRIYSKRPTTFFHFSLSSSHFELPSGWLERKMIYAFSFILIFRRFLIKKGRNFSFLSTNNTLTYWLMLPWKKLSLFLHLLSWVIFRSLLDSSSDCLIDINLKSRLKIITFIILRANTGSNLRDSRSSLWAICQFSFHIAFRNCSSERILSLEIGCSFL